MKVPVMGLIAFAFAGLAARGLGACATNDDGAPAEDSGAAPDAPVRFDASSSDAAREADAPDGAEPCSPDGWCYTTFPSAEIADAAAVDPNFVPVELEDVWPMPDHDAWAVADQGYVLRWTNHAWTFVFAANSPLYTVWAATKDDVWVGGAGGQVFHGTTTGGSLAFVKVDLGTTDDVIRIRARSATDILAVTANAIYRSSGAAFVPASSPIPRDGTVPTIADMWGSGDSVWIGAREVRACTGPDDCIGSDRTALYHWKGVAADAGASWDRIPLELQCGRSTCAIKSGATSPAGTHFLNIGPSAILGHGNAPPQVAHVTLRDAGILDASASQGDGGYIWELDDPALGDTAPSGIWAAADDSAWSIGSPGAVRHWDSHAWELSRASLTSPLVKPLHAIAGITAADGTRDLWIVGGNVAMHRSEAHP